MKPDHIYEICALFESMRKPKIFVTTPVFKEIADHPMVSKEKKEQIMKLWNQLEAETEFQVSDERFPSDDRVREAIVDWGADIVGCHLSHPINSDWLENSDTFAVCTSTAGFNHIGIIPGVLVTHTPGVLHKTVADFTIAVILANLRNIPNLHNVVWNGNWKQSQKWDLDENLSNIIDKKVVGIVGLGEIGKELVKRLSCWGVKMLYYDIKPQKEFAEDYKDLEFVEDLNDVFRRADIVSLHIPLNSATRHIIGEEQFRLMKNHSLLVNTARGPVLDSDKLMQLLEDNEISVNLSFDVYEDEPIREDDLNRYKKIAEQRPDLRFVFIPHNASADADTRAEMAIMILQDILALAESKSIEDLEDIRLIPSQRYLFGGKDKRPDIENYRITSFWER